MLSDIEVRNLHYNLKNRLDQLLDPVEFRCVKAQVMILECILDED